MAIILNLSGILFDPHRFPFFFPFSSPYRMKIHKAATYNIYIYWWNVGKKKKDIYSAFPIPTEQNIIKTKPRVKISGRGINSGIDSAKFFKRHSFPFFLSCFSFATMTRARLEWIRKAITKKAPVIGNKLRNKWNANPAHIRLVKRQQH